MHPVNIHIEIAQRCLRSWGDARMTQKMKVENCPKVLSKIHFRPKMSAEKELRGENGAFDTETAGFEGGVRFRSARKRPQSEKC